MALLGTFNSATHDPASMFVFFGPRRITGWAPGDFLTIEPVGDDHTLEEGPDGLAVWNRLHTSTVNVSLLVYAAAGINQYLWACHEADRAKPGGILYSFSFWEKNGLTKMVSARSRIIRRPTIVRGATAGTITWNLIAQGFEGVIGGLLGTAEAAPPEPA